MSNTINATIICGLFDKDTKKQKISTQNAKNIIAKLILQHATGGTLTECQGLFTHSDGTIVFEPSIKIEALACKLPLRRFREVRKRLYTRFGNYN